MGQPKSNLPPRWATKLLTWWADPNTSEEVQGDLLELYAYWVQTVGKRQANWRYAMSTFKLLLPLAKREIHYPTTYIYSPTMLQNYFKIAFRNLLKHKGYSFINIFGLATGMAVAMLIGLWVWDEFSYNKYYKNYDRIAQVYNHVTEPLDQKQVEGSSQPQPMAKVLREKYGHIFKHVLLVNTSLRIRQRF